MKNLKFRVKAKSVTPTKTVVRARNFEIVIDEPEEFGGNDEAANPVEYLLATFSGCLNVMAHIIAKEMNIDLRGLEIDISGELNPARVFGQSYEQRAGYKQIEVTMKPDTDADEETLKKWLEVTLDRCPVSDNLQNMTPVKINLKKK